MRTRGAGSRPTRTDTQPDPLGAWDLDSFSWRGTNTILLVIGIIGYEGGNHRSVGFALERVGHPATVVTDADQLDACDRLILPGVGSAGATMASLDATGLVDAMGDAVLEHRIPFLGICIGLQLLLDHSEEDDTKCLGWIAGTVRRFPGGEVRVPQIGWNTVEFTGDHPMFVEQVAGGHFYFVNSYYADVSDPSVVGAWTHHGLRFPSALAQGNIVATQFHLEKSGPAGLALLARFAELEV